MKQLLVEFIIVIGVVVLLSWFLMAIHAGDHLPHGMSWGVP